MASGFQSFNDSGNYQIDGEYINPPMRRKGTVVTQAISSSFPNLSEAYIDISSDEIFAFSCSSYCVPLERRGNQIKVVCASAPGVTINYWIFGSLNTASSDYGMQVFNSSGVLVFDSSWKLFNVISVKVGTGVLNLPGDRNYAVVAQQFYAELKRFSQPTTGAPPFYPMLVAATSADSVKINGSTISVSREDVGAWASAPYGSGQSLPINWDGTWGNGLTSAYIIIDITGY